MNRHVIIANKSYVLFRGKFARVRIRNRECGPGWEVCLTAGGCRSRKWFPLNQIKEANQDARKKEAEQAKNGETLLVRERERLALAFYRLWADKRKGEGFSSPGLLELLQDACSREEERSMAATWKQGSQGYLEARQTRWTPQRKALIRRTIERFEATLPCPQIQLDDISIADVQNGLRRMLATGASTSTFRAYLAILAGVWRMANEQRLAQSNPALEALRRMASPPMDAQPAFLTLPACAALLEAAWAHPNRGEALLFVIGLLTGIRLAERIRLQYADIRLGEEEPYINVPAGKSKTHRQRAVYLQGTHVGLIRAFLPESAAPESLLAHGHAHEKARKERAYQVQNAFANQAGVKLSRNVLRHTAATYLCAYLESMGKAALMLGHSESMLARHYRALVTRKEALGFFQLQPPPATSPKPEFLK